MVAISLHEQRRERLPANLRRLLASSRRVRRDIEPDLQYIRDRQTVTHDGGPKDGLPIDRNSDGHVGTVMRAGHHQPKPPEHGLIQSLQIQMWRYAADESETQRIGGRKQPDAATRLGLGDSTALRYVCVQLPQLPLDDPSRRDVLRRLAIRGDPAFQQFIYANNVQKAGILVKESLDRELAHEPERAHQGHSRGFGHLGGIPEVSSRHGDQRFREALAKKNLQHPLVQIGEQVRQTFGRRRGAFQSADRFRVEHFQTLAGKQAKALGVDDPDAGIRRVPLPKLLDLLRYHGSHPLCRNNGDRHDGYRRAPREGSGLKDRLGQKRDQSIAAPLRGSLELDRVTPIFRHRDEIGFGIRQSPRPRNSPAGFAESFRQDVLEIEGHAGSHFAWPWKFTWPCYLSRP